MGRADQGGRCYVRTNCDSSIGAIMPASTSISEMKNLRTQPQPALNQRRHDAHISPANSSASPFQDIKARARGKPASAHDWRQQIFGVQGLAEGERGLVCYVRS